MPVVPTENPFTRTREVEVKYRVADLSQVEAALHRRGLVLSPPVRQDDQAYAEIGWQYGMSKLGRSFVRLRTQDGRHVFTLKRPDANELACHEYETGVADREQMHAAILAMGFYPTTRIVKTRRTARHGVLSLCLDDVEPIGAFFEIEKVIGPDESGEAVQAELDAFARSLEMELERTTETYDSLVRATQAAGRPGYAAADVVQDDGARGVVGQDDRGGGPLRGEGRPALRGQALAE